ncbi:hypothetical protein CVT24_005782 [Panaeolus cyanescens]|uniref:GATA-type domain-containing protein n=1 Tax=Panaeolus cyanescens TaxID=181874 RepID=A0A409V932_9AGAR|nr:hypothetical protein CVT24_005782 [Panaeolus cyanescens]
MDSLNFDGYTSYSDSSTPRTPSPTDMHFSAHHDLKHAPLDIERNIFVNNDDDSVVVHPNDPSYWSNHHPSPNFTFNNSTRPDLYDHEHPTEFHHDYFQQSSENWEHHPHHRPSEFPMVRRATFPYVRHDREEYPPFQQQHQQPENILYNARQENAYPDLPHQESFIPSMTNSPHSSYNDFEENANIKLEDTNIMVPSQPNSFYRQSPSAQCHPMTMTYLSPHTGLPVQHTDDAASKETQYLRRRCFNCHTTEPPSWRRSTLNPGKIVCNKCGLYERTHLRPRPLRFDELRAGNKARKQSTKAGQNGSGVSPKQSKLSMIKKEPREFGGLVRRSSVSSSSSVHSGSGASDWDDNVSIYSSGSAPPTSFNSPVVPSFPLSRDSQSPPLVEGGIRVPTNPLSDIASMHISGQQSTPLLAPNPPRKSHTSPAFYPASLPSSSPAPQHSHLSQDYFSAPSTGSPSESAVWTAEPAPESNGSLVASPPSS